MTRRRRARHAAKSAPVAVPRQRSATPTRGAAFTPLPAGTMRQRQVDYSNPAALAGLRTASDGHTVVMPAAMRTVTLTSAPPARSMDDTVTLVAKADAPYPQPWRDEAWTDCVDLPVDTVPSLLGSGMRLRKSDATCAMLKFLTVGDLQGPWFRPCKDNGDKYADSLAAFWTARSGQASQAAKQAEENRARARDVATADFHSRMQMLMGAAAPRQADVLSTDTQMFPVIIAAEFAGGVR